MHGKVHLMVALFQEEKGYLQPRLRAVSLDTLFFPAVELFSDAELSGGVELSLLPDVGSQVELGGPASHWF